MCVKKANIAVSREVATFSKSVFNYFIFDNNQSTIALGDILVVDCETITCRESKPNFLFVVLHFPVKFTNLPHLKIVFPRAKVTCQFY